MLGSQQIVTAQMGCRFKVSVNQGCSQGGVLSPLLWSLVVDSFLAHLNSGCLYTRLS
jgi:hypothetical protein